MPATPRSEPVDPGNAFLWPARVVVQLMEAQQQQWQALSAWQTMLAELQKDLYDRWNCQFADGARIDD